MENTLCLTADLSVKLNRSVVAARVDEAGNLLLRMSDGETVNLGSVRGPEGEVPQALLQELREGILTPQERQLLHGALQKSGDRMTGELRMAAGTQVGWSSGTGVYSDGQNLMITADAGCGLELAYDSQRGESLIMVTGDALEMNDLRITNVGLPEEPGDAVNKDYVDRAVGAVGDTLARAAGVLGGDWDA